MHPDHFSVAGPLDGRLLVFVHGSTASRSMWAAQVDDLSDRYRTVAVDLAGHGARRDDVFSIDGSVGELIDLIEELGGSAVVVGHSLGGYVAMKLASARPDLTDGLAISGATATYRGLGLPLQWLFGTIVGMAPGRFERQARAALERSVPPPLVQEVLEGGLSMRAGAQGMTQVPGLNAHRLLAAYPGPVLILNGERDRPNRRQEKAAVAACREGILRIIENAGHFCALNQPEAFSGELRGFLRSL